MRAKPQNSIPKLQFYSTKVKRTTKLVLTMNLLWLFKSFKFSGLLSSVEYHFHPNHSAWCNQDEQVFPLRSKLDRKIKILEVFMYFQSLSYSFSSIVSYIFGKTFFFIILFFYFYFNFLLLDHCVRPADTTRLYSYGAV